MKLSLILNILLPLDGTNCDLLWNY
jgi:hypothetical protein